MEAYYGPRPDVAELVPRQARVIYDVGCGTGLLGEALRAAVPGRQVFGIEARADAAEEARRRLDAVLIADGNLSLPEGWPAPDVLVFADVLEHMVDPWAVLAAWAAQVPQNTLLIVSLPNVAHLTAVEPLLRRGRWDYASEGVLDRTHLRFFTRDTGLDLIRGAGFEVDALHRNLILPPRGGWRHLYHWAERWARRRRAPPGAVPRPGFHLLDLFTQQYRIVARRGAR